MVFDTGLSLTPLMGHLGRLASCLGVSLYKMSNCPLCSKCYNNYNIYLFIFVIYICIYFIYENFKSLDVQTCILGHVGGVLRLNTFFRCQSIRFTQYLCKFCQALLLKLPSNKGLYLVAKPNSQPCPSRKTLVNASYMLARQANRITWEVSK